MQEEKKGTEGITEERSRGLRGRERVCVFGGERERESMRVGEREGGRERERERDLLPGLLMTFQFKIQSLGYSLYRVPYRSKVENFFL